MNKLEERNYQPILTRCQQKRWHFKSGDLIMARVLWGTIADTVCDNCGPVRRWEDGDGWRNNGNRGAGVQCPNRVPLHFKWQLSLFLQTPEFDVKVQKFPLNCLHILSCCLDSNMKEKKLQKQQIDGWMTDILDLVWKPLIPRRWCTKCSKYISILQSWGVRHSYALNY